MRQIVVLLVAFLTLPALNGSAAPRAIAPAPMAPTNFPLSYPTITTVNGGFVVAWRVETGPDDRIDAIALDANGRPVTAAARRLVVGAKNLRLFPSGSELLLTYEDERYVRRFLRVAADAAPLGNGGFPSFERTPHVAGSGDGRSLLLTRQDITGPSGIVITATGATLRENVPISSRVLSLPSGFLVLRPSGGGVNAQKLRSNGDVAGAAFELPLNYDDRTLIVGSAAESDDRILVITSTDSGSSAGGALLVGTEVARRLTLPAGVSPIKVLWAGNHYVLIVRMSPEPGVQQVAVMRFDRNGDALDAAPVVIGTDAGSFVSADAAWNGNVVNVVTVGDSRNRSRVESTTLRTSAGVEVVRRDTLSIMAARQNAPAAASDGVNTLAVWREAAVDTQRIRAALLDVNGTPTEPLTLGDGAHPAVAYGDGVYLAAWRGTEDELRVARISASGVLLGAPAVIAAVPDARSWQPSARPAVAWNGSKFLVVWNGPMLRGALVTPAGELTLIGSIPGGVDPALAWNGQRFVLVTAVKETSSFGLEPLYPTDVEATVLNAEGTALGEPRLIIVASSQPAVATSGSEFLVTAEFDDRLVARWLDRSASPLSTQFQLGTVARNHDYGANGIGWNGSAYVMAVHARIGGVWTLRVGSLAPLSTTPHVDRALLSRPDLGGGITVALVVRATGDPMLVFTDITHDDALGGSSRLLVSALSELPATGRRRAASH